jgi:3-isopropylmalate/(R)-2-methylmalate dehydratase small subunit
MTLNNLRGRVAFIFEEIDFDVDQIVGVSNMKTTDINELTKSAMQSYDKNFLNTVKQGDLLVGNHNFGYGHPHYPPMKAMRHLGIRGVIAESFSPGYWRGEISMGFPQIPCPGILKFVSRWDEIEVDWATSTLSNLTQGTTIGFEPLPHADFAMLQAGGLENYLKNRFFKPAAIGEIS